MIREICRQLFLGLTVVLAMSFAAERSMAQVINVTVDSHSGPWQFVNGGLNTSFQYGLNDHTPPLVVNALNGFDFSPGGTFAISYLNGLVDAGTSFSPVNAAGVQSFITNNNIGASGGFFPSRFFNSADYPSYLVELVGTFANDTGAIVGTPFEIGLSRSVIIPFGATRLQLGINDDIFNDNSGSFNVSLSLTPVPEPTSLLLLGSSAVVGFGIRKVRKAARREKPLA